MIVITHASFVAHFSNFQLTCALISSATICFDLPQIGSARVAADWQHRLGEFPTISRRDDRAATVISIRDFEIGGDEFITMAGPCSVETEDQLISTAMHVRRSGARMLRGGAFKPRSSPYAFQGLGLEGLKLLALAREASGLAIVTEVMSEDDVSLVAEYADVLQIGSRNMENFSLLKAAARSGRPILLKRGLVATIADLLQAAECIVSLGNSNVMLCERGIRTFETATRNTLDAGGIAILKHVTHLPVICDPSHACGIRDLVPDFARIGIAAGADGMIVEVHPNPDQALSDGPQCLTFDQFDEMMSDLQPWIALSQTLRLQTVGAAR